MDTNLPPTACFGFSDYCPPPVELLSSIPEARQHYEELSQCWVRHAWSGHCDFALFSERLEQWSRAFQALCKTQPLATHDRRAAAILEIQRRQFEHSLMLATFPPEEQPASRWWDDKLTYFKETVDHAAVAVDLSDKDDARAPCFSLECGINVHLYTVAVRCKDPVIRRRAIAILRSANRQEGLFKSDLVAHVAEKVMMLEEQGIEEVKSCDDVPEEARFQGITIHFDPARKRAEFSFLVQGKVVEEVLTWRESGCYPKDVRWLHKNPNVSDNSFVSTAKLEESVVNKRYNSQKRWHNGVVIYDAGSGV